MPTATAFDATLAQLRLPGWQLQAVRETGSTNTDLLEAARLDNRPRLRVTERQTAGRGRLGRLWESGSTAASLTFSLAWPLAPGTALDGLSLAVGVQLAESLHPQLRLKWPNDIWLDGRKLGGVLIEAVAGNAPAVVVGVGLNLQAPALPATAGLHALEPQLDAATLLARVAPPLARLLERWQGFDADWQARFAARDALAGLSVQGDGAYGPVQGVAEGVSRDGLLRLRGADGRVQLLRAGEVRLQRMEPRA